MFFTRFNPNVVKGVKFDAPSLVQPQFKDSCDISVMIRRALQGDQSVLRHPQYFDALHAPEDFADCERRLAAADSIWHDLPDNVKATFGTPSALLRFIETTGSNKPSDVASDVSNPSKSSSVTQASKPVESSSTEVPPSNT